MVEEISDLNRVKPSWLERISSSTKGTIAIAALCILADITCILGVAHYDLLKNHKDKVNDNNNNNNTQQTSLNTVQDGTLAVNNNYLFPPKTISAAQDTIPPDTIEYENGRWIYNYDSLVYMPDTTIYPTIKK